MADARAREGTDSEVAFTVTLSRASSRGVTVDYSTTDGTALAGEDYTATSGTLTFAAGVVEQTVSVPVLDDLTDEGEESFTLTLSNASGAVVGDGEATGTIANSDPMPRAWIAHLGRTVAAQAVSAIEARLEDAGDFGIVIGGMSIDGAWNPAAAQAEHEPLRSDGYADPDGGRDAAYAGPMSPRALLLGSAFRLGDQESEDSPAWTAWGRAASSGFESAHDEVRVDGDVTSAFLGADVSHGPWLAGLAVSWSEGDGSFEDPGDGASGDRGEMESRLTSLYPYARYRLNPRTDVWALAGYGTGELALTRRANETRPRDVVVETGLGMRMGAAGARSTVVSAGESGDLEVAFRTDAFWVRMESEAVESERSGRLAAATGEASRIRLVLEGSRSFDLDSGRTFTPSMEIGVRHDGGDAQTGSGVEVGAGARLAGRGFAIAGSVKTLVAHEDRGYEEWGASGSIRIDPGASGRGLSLAVAPSWGAASSGVERLWSIADAGGLAGDGELDGSRHLEAEVGYGLAFGAAQGVLTPYAGVSLVHGGNRALRTGARWIVGRHTALHFETAREAGSGDGPPAHSLTLRAGMRW